MQPVITASSLAASFGSKTIWRDASFEIFPGELVAVLGPNGAGKSTLLKMLLGLQKPGQGTLEVLGEAPKKGNPSIGYLPQSRQWDEETAIRGLDVVGFGVDGTRWGVSLPGHTKHREKQIKTVLHAVGASEDAERSIGKLSGGQRQRLLLAQTLVSDPKLLLLDEPFNNLDLRNQIAIAELIAKLSKERNLAILLVTHDLNPLFSLVDRVLYIARNGVAIGTPAEVITSDVLSRLYGTPIEVLEDHQGRRFIVGMEDVIAHPHPHSHPHKEHHA